MRKLLLVGAAVLALFALVGAVTTQAGTPSEIFESGDAGDTLKTAQRFQVFSSGSLPLNSINGSLSDANDEDVYQICLTGGGTFSATTNPDTAVGDPMLFLFDVNGRGVYGSDDKSGSLQAKKPAGDPSTPQAPGIYYLAISSFANFPVSDGGNIFEADHVAANGTTVWTPTGPGGGQPLSGWTNTGGSSGAYRIALTGAIFCGNAEVEKDPELRNLWLCNQFENASGCFNFESGVRSVTLDVNLTNAIKSPDPKCVGFPTFHPDPRKCPLQTIGSFEFEVRWDAKLLNVFARPGDLWRGFVECAETRGEGYLQFRCNTKGKEFKINGPGTVAQVIAVPTPDVYSILIPNQLNGIATQLINQDCQFSDTQGHPMELLSFEDPCGDAAITIRYLEGDVHADCVINVHDQQQIAFRWGSRLGSLLYNDRYDLEPSLPKKGDGDIDAKDLQLVYGRFNSTCKEPHPAQDPVDPKAKVGPADDGNNTGG